jgi:alpha-glucosidase
MRLLLILLCTLQVLAHARSAETREITSPNGIIKVTISLDKILSYTVSYDNKPLLVPSTVDMVLHDKSRLSDNLEKPEIQTRSVREVIISPVPEKSRRIPDIYNEINYRFSNSFGVTFRAYDDGVAYRISTSFSDSITVQNEIAEFKFPENHHLYYSQVGVRGEQDIYHTSFEDPYQFKTLDSIPSKTLMVSPVLTAPDSGPKVIITESDLEDYPGMFLRSSRNNGLKGEFAPYPKTEKVMEGLYSLVYVSERSSFIARTKGTRDFPWRVVLIAAQDKELPANDLVYRLASPSRVKDVSWIKPRKSTEEWIISSNVFNVPFKSGVNTNTYKYYIDFAKRFGFEQVLMDAGWSDNNDLFKITPEIDMEAIVAYAKSQGIKLGMWTLAMTLDRQLEPALDQFNKWGVDFIMTDFIERDDQKTVQFYHKVAQACARHRIMLMFHGSFKPAGFNRTYPHALTREAVLGSEYNMWSDKATPDHNLLLPFIRMTSGPLDYEPGLLSNATKAGFRAGMENVMSIGTRTQQLAMFLVYDSPLQLFSGNPSQGILEPDFMNLMGSLPTTYDTTIILDAKIGDYIVTARKKNNNWYIGAMNDLTPRELTFSLSFLDDKIYNATICRDGANADRYAADYTITRTSIRKKDKITIKMAPGGGYVLKLVKK